MKEYSSQNKSLCCNKSSLILYRKLIQVGGCFLKFYWFTQDLHKLESWLRLPTVAFLLTISLTHCEARALRFVAAFLERISTAASNLTTSQEPKQNHTKT